MFLWFFRGSGPLLLGNPIFCDFSGGPDPLSLPLDPRMMYIYICTYRLACRRWVLFSAPFYFLRQCRFYLFLESSCCYHRETCTRSSDPSCAHAWSLLTHRNHQSSRRWDNLAPVHFPGQSCYLKKRSTRNYMLSQTKTIISLPNWCRLLINFPNRLKLDNIPGRFVLKKSKISRRQKKHTRNYPVGKEFKTVLLGN